MKKIIFPLVLSVLLAASASAWAATSVMSDTTSWTTGEYVVDSDVTIADRVEVSGDVVLILNDGCVLTTNKGIHVSVNNSLTIKTPDLAAGSGKLVAVISDPGNNSDLSGIGGNNKEGCGTITIVSGDITASGSYWGVGIGSGSQPSTDGKITILGGTIRATGGGNAAGIGGGHQGGGGNITIAGGSVTANGGDQAAGIGGGYQGSAGTITILGGSIDATGGSRFPAPGIGRGRDHRGSDGTVTISGGSVRARGGMQTNSPTPGGAGIDADKITIDGGTIRTTGDIENAGIGGRSLTVNGGTTYAIGGVRGSGISSSTAEINGGVVEATGGENGAGISSGTVDINGGIVEATGGENGSGIGGGGKLKSGESSGAWIVASSVKMDKSEFKSGVLFDGNVGEVYGLTTISRDATISADMTLTVLEGATLKTAKLLKVEGTLDLVGYIVNDGTIVLKDMAALRALTSGGRVSGGGVIAVIDMTYFHNDGSLVATTDHAADAQTIEKYIVKGAGLEVKNGAVTRESALDAIDASGIELDGTADAGTVTPLKIVDVNVASGDKFAVLTFEGISGASLVSGDRTIGVDELNIVKIIADGKAKRLKRAADGAADGTYAILSNGAPVLNVRSSQENYTLNVFVADDGECDLAKGEKDRVVDPLVLVKSTGSEPHDDPISSGGGGCATCASLAAMIGIAALAVRRGR